MTLRQGREWSGFDGLIESLLRKIDCRLIKVSNSLSLLSSATGHSSSPQWAEDFSHFI